MIISEQSIEAAIIKLLNNAKFPIPKHWNLSWDRLFIRNKLVPAYIESLAEIEQVDFCYGFDKTKIDIESARINKGDSHA